MQVAQDELFKVQNQRKFTVVYIADSDEVFTDWREINQSIVASPLQVFLDCMQLKGRGEEMAEAVYAKEIRK